ncbi:hypothetical protein ACIQUQ_15805 [Streptomyces sp. NPDC101118]|uniref:hypothetical protein n=1 Tax=Streptomyces sp. NPDC101118 TaxID=3366109 RepID=UPI00380BA7D6
MESHDQKQLVVLPWYLNALRAEGKAKKVGPESVRGWPTTHYRSTVAVTAVDEIQQRTFPGMNGRVQTIPVGNGVHVAHLDAWLDERGRLVRLHTRLAGALVTLDFRSFGSVERITLPEGARTVLN